MTSQSSMGGAAPGTIKVDKRRLMISGLSAVMLGVTGTLAACGKRPPAFDNLDITDSSSFNTAFSLPDTRGQLRSIGDYKNNVVVLFFGFTQCPDVCPTSLAELAEAKKRLGADGKRLQVLFVTVDPERDTPMILDAYMAAFDSSFVALRPPNDAAVAQITKNFHIFAAKVPVVASAGASTSAVAPTVASSSASAVAADQPASASTYTVEHTAASFVFDPTGKLRLYARDGQGVDRWVHDFKILLAGK